jgi:hypothetical protein
LRVLFYISESTELIGALTINDIWCNITSLPSLNPATGGRWSALELITSLYISIIGGVISYYICKWLEDGDE